MVKFIAVAALGKNRQIGLNGGLPWKLPDEYEHFKKLVRGQYVLIGRKNYELHNEDVEGTKPLVLSRSDERYFKSMNEVITFATKNGIDRIFVVGGGEIYKLALPYVSEFYCSIIDYDGQADTFFPEYQFYEWEMLSEEVHEHWTVYHMKKHPDLEART
jgi:dihydrofolate reductase